MMNSEASRCRDWGLKREAINEGNNAKQSKAKQKYLSRYLSPNYFYAINTVSLQNRVVFIFSGNASYDFTNIQK